MKRIFNAAFFTLLTVAGMVGLLTGVGWAFLFIVHHPASLLVIVALVITFFLFFSFYEDLDENGNFYDMS